MIGFESRAMAPIVQGAVDVSWDLLVFYCGMFLLVVLTVIPVGTVFHIMIENLASSVCTSVSGCSLQRANPTVRLLSANIAFQRHQHIICQLVMHGDFFPLFLRAVRGEGTLP